MQPSWSAPLSVATDSARAAARARTAHGCARGPPRRARRSVPRGARGHLLRRALARLRMHVERARGGAALRRRHRAGGRVLARDHHPAEVLAFYGPLGLGRERRFAPALIEEAIANAGPGPRCVRDDVRGCAAVRRLVRPRPGRPGSARVRLRALGRAGFPDVGGDAIPFPMRLLHVARDFSLFLSAAGPDEARGVIERRAGRLRAASGRARRCSTSTTARRADEARCGSTRSRASRLHQLHSPAPDRRRLRGHRRDHGLKSPWLREHSTAWPSSPRPPPGAWASGRLRALCGARTRARPRPGRRVECDLGEAGPLGFGEWERVRLHPHFTERAFAQSPTLAPIGLLAGPTTSARRIRVSPRRARAGARPSRPHPRRRRLLAAMRERGRTGRRSTRRRQRPS